MEIKEPEWLLRTIEWFDKKTEVLVGEIDLRETDLNTLQDVWALPADNPMIEMFRIDEAQAGYLAELLQLEFEFERYDYFLSAYTKDLEASQRDGGFMGQFPPPKRLPAFLQVRRTKPK